MFSHLLLFLSNRLKTDYLKIKDSIGTVDLGDFDAILFRKLIVAEDHRFLYHFGVDYLSVVRVVFLRYSKGKIQGASTIEQQLVRVITSRYEKTMRRKVREQFLAILLSQNFDKSLVAQCYLRKAYIGNAGYGMQHLKEIPDAFPKDAAREFSISLLKYPAPKIFNKEWENKVKCRIAYIKDRELKLKHYL